MKAGGSSLALLGYKGPGPHPWTQINQKELGAGGAAIFTILGMLLIQRFSKSVLRCQIEDLKGLLSYI